MTASSTILATGDVARARPAMRRDRVEAAVHPAASLSA